jgi:N-acetyl-gamma-glutamyl-phosphate reductase
MVKRVGVVGARGHVGGELLPILGAHPEIEIAWATSSTAAGTEIHGVTLREADPAILARDPVDVVFLALPNGESAPWASAAGDALVVDLSADHRFDDAWVYGQPDRFRSKLEGAKRIAAPGCYATAAQLAVSPIMGWVTGKVHFFGVSGYSGAGTTRSDRNDPEILRDNILPYALVGHMHEREVSRHGIPCFLVPHVASFFRGLVVTASVELPSPAEKEMLETKYRRAFAGSRFVELTAEPPRPRDMVGKHGVRVGGLALSEDRKHAVVVAALDNLLGGAASQAVRAMNLALGFEEGAGLR